MNRTTVITLFATASLCALAIVRSASAHPSESVELGEKDGGKVIELSNKDGGKPIELGNKDGGKPIELGNKDGGKVDDL